MMQSGASRESGVGSRESGVGTWFRLVAVVSLALSFGACLLFIAGCGKPPAMNKDAKDSTAVKANPWEAAAKRLRKDADTAGCKTALGALNNELLSTQDAVRPAGLTPEAERELAAAVPLSPDDLAEIRGSSYSAHDPVYLAECLFLRDAAKSLDVQPRPGQSPEQVTADLADIGFAWVCRQVYLNPWMIPTPEGSLTVSLPPTYVLRRGSGSGLERAYVFLALLQQMGLDGCLVGGPDAGGKTSLTTVFSPDKKTLLTGAARGPFWAVGVRVGGDVRLYDPWRGEPFPASLGALKANPAAQKAWLEDKANASGVTADDVRAATVLLAVPVNSLAPRVATLEQQIGTDLAARLAVNPTALRNRFPDPKPAFWNPPQDGFAYGRTARTVLPPDDGGTDRNPPGLRLLDRYIRAQFPAEVLALPAELRGNEEAAERVRGIVAGTYGTAFFGISGPAIFATPTPRERLQRGQFQDAARDLVVKQDQFAHGLERLRNNANSEADIRAWATRARELYDEQGLAATAEGRQQAAAAVEAHWKRHADLVQLLVDRSSAELGRAEATLLMAMCKHEQAERAQARLEHAGGPEAQQLKSVAADAWAVALGEWRTYAERARVQAGFPGRDAHVQALVARAEKFAGQK